MKGKKNGYGTFVYPDGSKYVGNWVNDEKQGFGTYYYVNGDIYEGDWYENKRHGQGKKYISLFPLSEAGTISLESSQVYGNKNYICLI
jgi:hypothetical protein